MEREFLGVQTGYHIFTKYTKCFDLRKGTTYEIGENETSGMFPKLSTKNISRKW